MTEPSGILIINKHAGTTSHDIVNRIRRLYGTKRVGHTGTLDPDATGVLVVLVGRAAKAAEYLVSDTKKYRATLRLGLTTDTEDASGTVLTVCDNIPSEKTVKKTCSDFIGKIKQTPPMYSALKKDGQKLCDLARKGIVVEREAREITVFELLCSTTETDSDYILDVYCSSGTYIRTLCADIGKALGCGGIMATLQRTYAGGFSIEDSITVKELEKMSEEERISHLKPTESLFDTLPKVSLSDFYEKLCRNGCEIYQKKINTSIDIGQCVRIADKNGNFFALGEVKEYEAGTAIKAIKFFDIK
ncbi:MAG: tRNA pseudouridine(55) synthase TruB [Ruminococcaceae bacterium]|nr:tRNA pseudouridine(55) synthase TruB [Oscillospiraceae bacterium]